MELESYGTAVTLRSRPVGCFEPIGEEVKVLRKLHNRMELEVTLLDLIKAMFGWKIDMSACVMVEVHCTPNGVFEELCVIGYETNCAVWKFKKPETMDSELLVGEVSKPEVDKLHE